LDENISELSDIESDTVSVGEIEEILTNFEESENFITYHIEVLVFVSLHHGKMTPVIVTMR
jgi:hypothetical protein